MEVVIYFIGIIWLKVKLDATWTKAFAVGLTPFIIGDAVKIACASICGKLLYPETLKLRAKLSRREKDE